MEIGSMYLNFVDIGILIVIALGALIGFKNGVTKQLVSFVGFIAVILLSFLLKNLVSGLLYEYLPFINFDTIFKGASSFNILFYEIIGFIVIFSLLMIILRILLRITGVFETILKYTIILGIPSKIFGAIVGAVEYICYTFVILYFLSLPTFDISEVKKSKIADKILYSTPILSDSVSGGLDVYKEVDLLITKYNGTDKVDEFNKDAISLYLEYKIISVKSVEKLVDSGKLKVDGIEEVISKYKEENNGNN